MREKLIEILSVPIYPHEQADPAEVVADYLIDNDVVPVFRCRKCKWYNPEFDVCEFWSAGRHPDHYCGEGVPRDDMQG